jgi:uncharacterized surface protein with fasciclin (FAS1) repeats
MNRIVLALGVASALLLASLVPATVSATGDHSMMNNSHMSMKHKDMFDAYLMSNGYIMDGYSQKEKRMAIMKFQRENGLRETGNLNFQTRKAIKKAQMLPTIVGAAVATPALSTLVAAVKAGGLVETLSSAGPFTVFAPTNDAFAKVPSATLASLLTPEGKPALVNILTYHVVSGKAMSGDLVDGQEIKTVQGKTLKVMIKDGKVFINNAQVVIADVKTKNGVVHVIDSVLMP